jgi:hypothetical protein
MRFVSRILLLVVSCLVVRAQARFPMKYLDEVGLLGLDGPDKRNSVDLRLASVVSENGDALRFEGRDHKGNPWRIWVPQTSGAGWTEVWTADFDHNGQPDLLIGSHPAINGRCVLRAEILFLMFDQLGRPMPWLVSTEIPNGNKFPFLPAILLDINRDGRAEIVTTQCAYGNELKGHWTDWSITGIYEARDAQWIPLRSANVTPYVRVAAKANGISQWLPPKPREWAESLSGIDASNRLKLERLIPPDENCHGVNIQVVDGRVVAPANDPCEESHYQHAAYSDGRTRRGWPWVVIDGAHGRDTFIAKNEDALRRVIQQGYRVKLLGDDAEPLWLWAEEAETVVPLP